MSKKQRVKKHLTVVFTKDYANKKAGEQYTCYGMEASLLVQQAVAEFVTENAETVNPVAEVQQDVAKTKVANNQLPKTDSKKQSSSKNTKLK